MSGSVKLNISVYVEGGDLPSYMVDRLNDLTDFFNVSIGEWTRDNVAKFDQGIGAEASGKEVDPGVYWEPLSPGYLAQKERDGFGGALMVRTGSLKASLSDPNLILRDVGPDHAVFGEPLDPFDALKVSNNWTARQSIFFSGRDQMMIKEKFIKHVMPDMANKRPFSAVKAEVAAMDAEFEGLTGESS